MNDLQQKAFIDLILIQPIEEILMGLELGGVRNISYYTQKDLNWIQDQQDKFFRIASETFGLKLSSELMGSKRLEILNDHNRATLTERFKSLLQYFKNLNN